MPDGLTDKGEFMAANDTCQTWCTEHNEDSDECRLSRNIFQSEVRDETPTPTFTDPHITALVETMRAVPHPERIDTVLVDAIHDEDEGLDISIEFWNFLDGDANEPRATLAMSLEDLEAFHGSLGQAIADLKRGQ